MCANIGASLFKERRYCKEPGIYWSLLQVMSCCRSSSSAVLMAPRLEEEEVEEEGEGEEGEGDRQVRRQNVHIHFPSNIRLLIIIHHCAFAIISVSDYILIF